MPATINQRLWVDGVAGNDGNSGLTPALAKKTIAGGLGAFVANSAHYRQLVILRGTFVEGGFILNTAQHTKMGILCMPGQVVIDGNAGALTNFYTQPNDASYIGSVIAGANFKDFGYSANGIFGNMGSSLPPVLFNCGVVAVTPACQGQMRINNALVHAINCTFYYIYMSGLNATIRNCADLGCTWAFTPTGAGYNASPTAGVRGVGGWDTATFPPPFTNAAGGDFSFNKLHAQYAKYRTGGAYGGQVGATWNGSFMAFGDASVSSRFADQLGWQNCPFGAFINDERYYVTGVGPGPDGPADAGPTYFDANNDVGIDVGLVVGAKSGRLLGPVVDLIVAGSTRLGAGWLASESGASVVDSSKLSATRHIECRAHTASFNQADPPGSTLIDWTEIERGKIPGEPGPPSITGCRYYQERYTLRTDGTP